MSLIEGVDVRCCVAPRADLRELGYRTFWDKGGAYAEKGNRKNGSRSDSETL